MAADFGAIFDLVTDPGHAAWRQAAAPFWLWNPKAERMRWANGLALALWNADDMAALARAADTAMQPGLARLARIAGSLPRRSGRIERLRLFLNGRAMNLTCRCELVSTATERLVAVNVLDKISGLAGTHDFARDLLQGMEEPALATTADGAILFANAAAGAPQSYDGIGALIAGLPQSGETSGTVTHDGMPLHAVARSLGGIVTVSLRAPVSVAPPESSRQLAPKMEEPVVTSIEDAPADEPAEPDATEVIFNPAWDDGKLETAPEAKPEADVRETDASDDGNVLPFRGQAVPQIGAAEPEDEQPSGPLAAHERDAFRNLARALGARMEGEPPAASPATVEQPRPAEKPRTSMPALDAQEAQMLLSRLPLGILVYRHAAALYANRAFLEMFGFANFTELTQAGDVSRLMPRLESDDAALLDHGMGEHGVRPALLVARDLAGRAMRVVARLQAVRWQDEAAMLLSVRPPDGGFDYSENIEEAAPSSPPPAEEAGKSTPGSAEAELETIVGLATDGVAILDEDGNITLLDRQAESLFSRTTADVSGMPFTDLFAQDSRAIIAGYLDSLRGLGVASLAGDGRRVRGRTAADEDLPLHLLMGLLSEASERRYCAVLRDIANTLRVEADLTQARKQAESASKQKSEFLARISHELRTPLNSIIGFSEVILEERFGAIGNERYQDYVRDIHSSGGHLLGLVNDLLDLSKVEAGKLELNFTGVDINEVAVESIRLMLQEAARGRVIVRSSLGRRLPAVVADHRSLRQILLNLLSNAIKFTLPGGQVVLSTRQTDTGEVQIRVRDTGIGMEQQDLAVAMEPFRQVATAPAPRMPGAGLGLPLTKALSHANRARFHIESQSGAGTLTEITFPPEKVLAT